MTSSPDAEVNLSQADSLFVGQARRGRLAELLISVRDQDELLEVRKSPVGIIDLKEPKRGPLAPADVQLWRYADQIWQQQVEESTRRFVKAKDDCNSWQRAFVGNCQEAACGICVAR